MILPGTTLGMVGGGQLGRMFTVAARTMGYRVVVLDPDPHSPAGALADEHLQAGYTDARALARLGEACAAISTEFENVPAATLSQLAAERPVRPSAQALELTQNRIREKTFIRQCAVPTAAFAVVSSAADFDAAGEELRPPLVLKRAAFGYDGKGQVPVEDLDDLPAAFEALGGVPCVLERRVALAGEISVVLARSADGETACFPVAENIHRDGILFMSIVPARVSAELASQARRLAVTLAQALDYCGVLAVEFFVSQDGELLVNELAPRPHNSGHYTLEACATSQFEQQVRMLCGLPAGDTRLLSPVAMVNLLGDLWREGPPDWSWLLAHPQARLRLYGKREARPGRKMGHFCCLDEDLDAARRSAEGIIERLAAP